MAISFEDATLPHRAAFGTRRAPVAAGTAEAQRATHRMSPLPNIPSSSRNGDAAGSAIASTGR